MTEPIARETLVQATRGLPELRITGAATGAVVAPASGGHR